MQKAKPPALNPVFAQLFPTRPGKGEVRRQRVLDAAIEVLAKEGLAAISHEAVGRRLRMRRSHVAYYFPTVAEMVESCVRYVSGTAQGVTVERIAAAGTPREKFTAYVEANFTWAEAYPTHAAFMMHFYSLCTHTGGYRELHRRVREMGRDRVMALLRDVAAGSGGKRAVDETALRPAAEIIQAVITSNLVELLTGGTPGSLKATRDRTVAQARTIAASLGNLKGLLD